MNQKETLLFYDLCVRGESAILFPDGERMEPHERWNQWAQAMLDERKALEESGEWVAKKEAWEERAKAKFSTSDHPHTFNDAVNFAGFIFPGKAYFSSATFEGAALFWSATFEGEARFVSATFQGGALFWSATFEGEARFVSATFQGGAVFWSATFEGEARFVSAMFQDEAEFSSATFQGAAGFGSVTFQGEAGFRSANFAKATDFEECWFKSVANFNAIQTSGAFSLDDAKFHYLPDFIQAHFLEPPRLDNITIKPVVDEDGKPHAPAMWRKLKDMAGSNKDFQNELEFFANEMKSARGVTDFWYKPTCLRWAAGWFYQILSNFGRSILRPLGWWLALTVACFYLYIAQSPELPKLEWYKPWHHAKICVVDDATNFHYGLPDSVRNHTSAPTEAKHLAWRNALLFIDSGAESARRIYGCLYGLEDRGSSNTIVPPVVSMIATAQKILSTILIFLFGLGVRNLLRMK